LIEIAMKSLLMMTVALGLPINVATVAWADAPVANYSHPESAQTRTVPMQQNGSAATLVIPSRATPVSGVSSEHLDRSAEDINQTLAESRPQRFDIREVINLPPGMIIRAGSRGGIGVGTEF
jgi:hypothetical protein